MNELRIVFMGTPDFATASLKALVESEYKIVAVITAPDRPAGRGQKMRSSSVKDYAIQQNLKVLQPHNLKDEKFIQELKSLNANLQIVVAFRMLPKIVWSMPNKGTINLHASLLPKYRGAAPINWAIINGEKQSGVTTFFIEEKIDTGEIILQEKTSISENETAGELHDKLMNIGSNLVCKTVDLISNNKVNAISQNGEISEAPKIFKPLCKLNWNDYPEKIHNKIRGLSPYPAAWTNLTNGIDLTLKVFQSKVEYKNHKFENGFIISDNKSYLKVATKKGFIEILELQLSGKKRMKIEDFLRGFKINDDFRFE